MPYKVIKKEPKYFILDIGGKQNMVSVDRLKKPSSKRACFQFPLIPQMNPTTPRLLHNLGTPK